MHAFKNYITNLLILDITTLATLYVSLTLYFGKIQSSVSFLFADFSDYILTHLTNQPYNSLN